MMKSNRSAASTKPSTPWLQPPALDSDQVRALYLPTMSEGTIAGLTDKGFGFIKIEGAAKDLFFHSNELVDGNFDSLRVGDKLTFEIAEGPKGQFASKVSKA